MHGAYPAQVLRRAPSAGLGVAALTEIAALYALEEQIRGQAPERGAPVRQDQARLALNDLEHWLHTQLPRLSAKTPLAATTRSRVCSAFART